jgi:DNA-binding transcriptional regulator GbsR (MarR family)
MNNKNIEEVFLGIGRRACRLIGWKEAIGQVFVLLYLRNQPLSLDDICTLTNLSKSNVWGIIQQLLRLGAVNKAWNTENRKDYYVAERDFDLILKKGVLPLLKTKVDFLDSYLETARKELDSLSKEVQGKDVSIIKSYEKMLDDIVSQKTKAQYFVSILMSLK